ncbi:patatin-like phospholipase family protein [Cryptosporangium arvum]|uniref:Putative esterase of the alpha-beta hydrolase superfamily n=1 Tax=Cryptosporangium arvum DSM 44712 TaxID=927661 RepID=A0A010YJI6_9ACTN|nr:patatin-like phospholipase family protein [Cryptosporangium arvum]EXG80400.1 putative esterase of the alpha-beta hydrolase superfamily [Cryptosporangium arvum DSM 44712]
MGRTVGFVLGGGGVLGAVEVGMVRALYEAGIHPDLVVGTSIGALNGVVIAAVPPQEAEERLTELWSSTAAKDVFRANVARQVGQLVRSGTHAHTAQPLRALLAPLKDLTFEDLPTTFQCCAASIERAAERWFSEGPLIDAVLASCAVPGLLPPVKIDGEHYLDGGLVNSIPVSRAIELGADQVFVLQVGRIERPLQVPTRPWEVAMVSFEIARRHRFARDMASLPTNIEVHVLPTGLSSDTSGPLAYRSFNRIEPRIESAYRASAAYLVESGLV